MNWRTVVCGVWSVAKWCTGMLSEAVGCPVALMLSDAEGCSAVRQIGTRRTMNMVTGGGVC